jgi:hypothetical protein
MNIRFPTGFSVKGKPMQDLLDIHYHDEAMKYLLANAAVPVTVDLLKKTHTICFPSGVDVKMLRVFFD